MPKVTEPTDLIKQELTVCAIFAPVDEFRTEDKPLYSTTEKVNYSEMFSYETWEFFLSSKEQNEVLSVSDVSTL